MKTTLTFLINVAFARMLSNAFSLHFTYTNLVKRGRQILKSELLTWHHSLASGMQAELL